MMLVRESDYFRCDFCGNFYFPEKDITIVAWVTVQADKPKPGVANAIFRDIGKIMAPEHAPLQN